MKKHLIIIIAIMIISVVISCDKTTNSDNEPPTVAITYPANNSEFVQGTVINIRAEATDNKGIKKVEFYIDGEIVGTDSTNSYKYDWNTEGVTLGNHTLYAKAEDINNNETQSDVINVSIVSGDPINPSNPNPSHNSIDVSVNPIISWECSDPQGDPLLYDVYLGTDPSPGTEELVVEHQDSLYYDPGTLLHDQAYYWKIIAVDADSNEASSEIWQFATLDVGAYINIPAEYSTIQAGIEAASDGDIVLVEPGTYIENIDFLGRNITVASKYLTTQDTSYISQTIIDGNQQDRVVNIENIEGDNARLSGFSIINGKVYVNSGYNNWNGGGGISCTNSILSLDNLIIEDNKVYPLNNNDTVSGGGLFCLYSNINVENVIIFSNYGCDGCGIECLESNLYLKNCKIENNSNEGNNWGAAFSSVEGTVDLENVSVNNNESGGISISGSELIFNEVDITHNQGYGMKFGGTTISCFDNIIVAENGSSGLNIGGDISGIIENININNNHDYGVHIYRRFSDVTLKNMTVSNNYGIGIKNSAGNVTLENVDIFNNTVNGYLATGNIYGNSSTTMENVYIKGNGNEGSEGGGICFMTAMGMHSASLSHVTVEDNISEKGGGGLWDGLNLTISMDNVIIANNSAFDKGGGIWCYGINLSMDNVVIANNSADEGGAFYSMMSSINQENCILWNNAAEEIVLTPGSPPYYWNTFTTSFSDIKGGENGIVISGSNQGIEINWEEGNINNNPLFIAPDAGDFHLQPGSPCINVGNPDPEYNDPDGTRNDMGAYGGPGGNW